MKVDYGYVCKKCGKVYHKGKHNIPIYCKKCGCDLVKERYDYNLTYDGEETMQSNMWGGYDYTKTILTKNVVKTKLVRKCMQWKVFKGEE